MTRSRALAPVIVAPVSERPHSLAESERVFWGPYVKTFINSLKANGELAQKLIDAGHEPLNPAKNYPAAIFINLVALARQGLFPDLPPHEGYRQLGRRYNASFLEKGRGRLIGLALPFLGPERMIKAMEDFPRHGSNFQTAVATKEGDRHWRVAFRHTGGLPGEFVAGGLTNALERAGTPPTLKIVVTNSDPAKEMFDLEITW